MRDCLPTCPPAHLPYLDYYLPTYLTYPLGHLPNFESRFTTYPLSFSTPGPLHLASRSIASQSCTWARLPHTRDKSHRRPRSQRRCAPAPAAASSKSGRPWDRSRPAGRLHTPVPCSLCTSTSTHDRACSTPLPFCPLDTTASQPAQQHLNTTSDTPIPS